MRTYYVTDTMRHGAGGFVLSPCAGTRTRVRVARPVVVSQFDMSTGRCHNLLQSPQIGHHATNALAGWLAMRCAQLSWCVVLALASAYHVGPANITGPHVRAAMQVAVLFDLDRSVMMMRLITNKLCCAAGVGG